MARGIDHRQGSRRTVDTFRDHDVACLLHQHEMGQDADTSAEESRAWTRELEEMFAQDEKDPV